MSSEIPWAKGLDTRLGSIEVKTADQPDAVGDGFTRIGAVPQVWVSNLVNGTTPKARLNFDDIGVRIYGALPVSVHMTKVGETPVLVAWEDRGTLFLESELEETIIFNIGITAEAPGGEPTQAMLDELEMAWIAQDRLGIGAPPP
jgi:hypothetical protein